jgi:protein gp37
MFADKLRYGQDGDVVRRSKTKFDDPLRWVKSGNPPKMCFTCSWSDFFIAEADEDGWRNCAWKIIRQTPQITYQMLTKRAGRILPNLPEDWGGGYENVWLGVSVESEKQVGRIATLREVPAAVRWVSFEPLLSDIGKVDLSGIHWAVIGGESGSVARAFRPEWARNLIAQCRTQGVAVFVKQLGSYPVLDTRYDKTISGFSRKLADRKGGDMDEWPEDLRIREYPR